MPRRLDGSILFTLALLAVCAVLGALAWWQWRALQEPAPAAAGTAATAAAALVEPPRPGGVTVAADEYREMVERPLFTASRRPPEEPVQEKTQAPRPPAKTPDWKLVGTVVSDGQNHALFWDQKGRRFVRVAPGDNIEGWEVAQIDKSQVLVKQQEKEYAYLLPEF
jgi:YD repeat-containing protein